MLKKTVSLLLCLMLLVGTLPAVFAEGSEVVLLSKAVSAEIVIPVRASAQEQKAAEILSRYLEEITGVAVPVVADLAADRQIILETDPEMREEAYVLAEKNGMFRITGGGKRGVLYGAFAFLEKLCGCRWYVNDAFLIPSADEISVPAGYSFSYTPYFEYRETDWGGRTNPEFSAALSVNGGNVNIPPEELGGAIGYFSGYFAHTLSTCFCSAATYFDAHPEYFALRDGKRTPNQLCLTNPDVLRIVTDEVLDLLKSRHDPTQSVQILSLTQHDNGDYCTCQTCKALDDKNGSQSGTMLTFVNAVADAVKQAGYDNVAIDTFAYQYTRQAPTNVVPRDNVIVRLCSIECCFGHPLDDPDCEENAKFMKDLADWSKICDHLYVWDYGTNYSEYITFFPNFNVMQKNMQIFYEHNVKGVFGEGNSQTAWCDGEFKDLRLYLQAKLMQDPYMDFESELDGFLQFYYGDGWESIKTFILECSDKGVTARKHVGIFDRAKGSLPGVKLKDIDRYDALWAEAEAGARTDEQLARVKRSEFCWRYWKCANNRGEFSVLHTLYQRMKARDDLYLDLVDAGTTILGETNRKRALSDCYALHLLRIPFCWTTLYDDPFWDFISPYVVTIYRNLGALYAFTDMV
ncbi:MAG: DUF4838 domain-containing protein [Clostridia bacterium]|nr:DUF4838 domain-containing protein [Clostridia bacterium]